MVEKERQMSSNEIKVAALSLLFLGVRKIFLSALIDFCVL